MLYDIAILIAGLLLLTAGAEGLVRGSASLAIRFGLTPLVVGLTVVAFGTSTPELVVSLGASVAGQADIALGNVVGSNIFNVGVILGLTALIYPVGVSSEVVRKDAPLMIGVSLVLLGLLHFGLLSRGVGMALVAALVAYTGYAVYLARRERSAGVEQQFADGVPSTSGSALRDAAYIAGGLVLLVFGSRLLVSSATDIARLAGVSEAVIGLTIIAAGTSMPELATSVVAAVRGQSDIAVGNVVGSNIFNILGILGISTVVAPPRASGITDLDLWVMVLFAAALLPLLYTRLTLHRWEGLLLLVGYAAYLWVLWP